MFLIREAVGSRIYLHEVWRWFMWGLLNAATAPIKSAANQFARNQLAAAMRKAGLNTVRAYRRSPVGSPEELAAARKLTANVPALQGLAAGSGGLTAIGVSNLTGFTGQLEGALNQVGPAVDRFFGRITPQAIQQFGREQEKKGWGGVLEVSIPGTGFLAAPFIPNTQPSSKPSGTRPVGTQAVLNGKPVYWGGDNYGWQQLNQTGSSATLSSLNTPGSQGRFIQEQEFRPIGGTPAERAQAAETSRVAQLTAQNPELQRYEDARKLAVAAGPGSAAEQSAEDMGMQMWAKANSILAAKLKPGQSGYDAIQRIRGQMGSPLNLPFDTSSPLGTTPPAPTASYDAGKVAQGIGLSPVPRNAFAGASAFPYSAFSQGPTLQSAPLGVPSEMPNASYEGVTGIQPMGSAVDKFDPKGAEAQKLLEMYKNAIFSEQK